MPEQTAPAPVSPVIAPPPPFKTWCEWANDGYRNALDGLRAVSSGVSGYKVGSRHTNYRSVSDQQAIVDEWRKQVEFYCGVPPLPAGITGRDTAFRVVSRDL